MAGLALQCYSRFVCRWILTATTASGTISKINAKFHKEPIKFDSIMVFDTFVRLLNDARGQITI